MRVVVAPGPFAGNLTAPAAAAAIAAGWRRTAPRDELRLLPLAGAGPGFVTVLHAALGGEWHEVEVTGPLGAPVPSGWLRVGGTAYLGAADPGPGAVPGRIATARGVAELVADARAAGVEEVVVGLGDAAPDLAAALGPVQGVRVVAAVDEPDGRHDALLDRGVRVVSGAGLVGELVGLDAELDRAALAVTGVDSFDWRSLRNSLVSEVARSASDRGVPCLVLAGQVSVGRREAASVGIDSAYAVADGPGGAEVARVDPAGALAALAERVAARWSR